MFKSPNNLYFESKGGQGEIQFKGHIKAESIEATSLTAPELSAIATQIEEMRARIREMSVSPSEPAVVSTGASSSSSLSIEPLISQIEDVREQLRSADLPRILANIDELRAARNPVSVQQLTRLQDQVAKLVGQINTLQDRVSVIEGRMAQLSPTSTSVAASAGGGNVVDAITSVVGAAAAQGAAAVVNRAAMKLEDMVSPGALYNLRKVSDRGPVRYAW